MQCQKFNDRWTFEKVDQDDRLKAFYGDDNKIIVTLPYDTMIREKRDKVTVTDFMDAVEKVLDKEHDDEFIKEAGVMFA